MRKLYLVCYPRTASRYFTAILEAKLGRRSVHKTHNRDIVVGDLKIVGLIRNPLDQFTSAIAQGLEFGQIFFKDDETEEEGLKRVLKIQISKYCKTLDSIRDRASLILDYNFFTSDPEAAAAAVLDLLGETDLGLEPQIPGTQVDENMEYMKSSKESKTYDLIRSVVENSDISLAENKYQELLALAYKP